MSYETDRMVREMRKMSREEIEQLVMIFTQLPTDAGFMISKAMEPPGATLMFGAYTAKVVLSGGGVGQSNDNNPSRALLAAWALAHLNMSELLRPPAEKGQ